MNTIKSIEKLKPYFTISLIVYFSFAIVGVVLAELNAEWAKEQIAQISEGLAPLLHENALIQALLIFLHNAFIQLMLILTFFLFGLSSFVSLAANGIVIGAVVDIFSKQYGILKTIAAIVPHGIIELPVFFLATGIGFWLGIGLFKRIVNKELFRPKFSFAMKLFIRLLLPATFIAALIEVFVTPLIFELL